MSRVCADRMKNFKKDEFAIQLMCAIGDTPISKFCKMAHLGYKDILQYMDQKKTAPPNYTTLEKIANASLDKTITADSLAMAAGFTEASLRAYHRKNGVKIEDYVSKRPAQPEPKIEVVEAPAVVKEIPGKPNYYRIAESAKPVPKPLPEKRKNSSLMLSSFIEIADTYDDYNKPVFYIFDSYDKFKAFGKQVRLHGLAKAKELATDECSPIFELRADAILKFLTDRPIVSFCALNGNKFAVVL